MLDLVPEIVEKTRNASVVLLGQSHIFCEHHLLDCLTSEALSKAGFDSYFIELDHIYQNNILRAIAQPISVRNTMFPFQDRDRMTGYMDTLFNEDDPDRFKKARTYFASDDYNVISAMMGNHIANHQALKSAQKNFEYLSTVDAETLYKDYIPQGPAGIQYRNEFMAERIAEHISQGHKGLFSVGAGHIESFEANGQKVSSLQFILNQKYDIECTTVIMTGPAQSLQKSLPLSYSEEFFPTIKHHFDENTPTLVTVPETDLNFPEHIVIFPEKALFSNLLSFVKKPEHRIQEVFQGEKEQWNTVCRQYSCPALILT